MKKLLKNKEHKDKSEKEDKKEKKEREKREKQEKKEKKKEMKKAKKGHHSDSSTSLDSQQSNETLNVVKTTTISGSPGKETKKTVVMETIQDDEGERSTTTTVEETKPTMNGETVVEKTTTTVTKSEPTNDNAPSTVVEKTTTTVKETTGNANSDPVIKKTTTTITKSEPSENSAPVSVVEKKTTTTAKSEPEPEKHAHSTTTAKETSTNGEPLVKKTTTTVTKSEPKPNEEKNPSIVQKTTPVISKSDSETTKPIESKTVVKETTNKSPGGREERVIVSKTTSEVESVPTTREFLEKNFPEAAMFDRSRFFQSRFDNDISDQSTNKPSHFSQRTVIREVGDGGNTVKTVTKVVTDEGGSRKTTTTTSSGDNDDYIVSTDTKRKADLPDWLEMKDDKRAPKGKAAIDDSIKIPSPTIDRKEKTRPKPNGPAVTEKITPSEKKKENISGFLDNLSDAAKEKPKKETAQPKATETDKNVVELMDSLESAPKVQAAPTTQASPNDSAPPHRTKPAPTTPPTPAPEEQRPAEKPQETEKPKRQERMLQERHVKRFIKDGEAFETITETWKDQDGKLETTTTTKRGHQPKEIIDLNANVMLTAPIKGSEKKKKYEEDDPFVHEGEDVNPEEVFEEILVVERRKKVRFPKSFLPRTPERPRSWGLPLDMLIDRHHSPRKTPLYRGREVKEEVAPTEKDHAAQMEDLDRLLSAIEAAK